jgi:hypothetical protein
LIDLEKELIEIKVAIARIEEKLDRQEDFELRIRELESYKNRLLGYAMALSAMIAIGVQFITKLILK